ncbi:hypothetical protein SteCoe_29689 [Stentor coeruleus]|uniref:Aurora kinase n=1 Tax=Stentor coeruleus TaxID=5963 RepID=A0A1R2B5D7_9CILI|nr:hypothetical protein SteCoe_29689 [Stentor coeruleus]
MTNRRQNSKLLFESPSVASGEEPELKRFDFDFERKMGDGAFGQVWRVRHKRTSQLYALKQVPKERVSKMLPQFRREVFIMYEINHPHIVKLYNHFEDDKFFYLIMELAEGNLFHKLYREKHFLERVAAQYFREVLLAVEYLHSHIPAIIHRDIKPENILLDKEGRLKLTDFGWSNYYSSDTPTPRFTMCGTLEYLPPEMVQEAGHDTSADIWCMGILLYEMLIGSTPFKSALRDQMLNNISMAKPKFPLTMPQLAKDLILKMLEKEPSKRPTAIKIKEHQWMMEHVPIRPTITQELSPKIIPELGSPKGLTGYVVISKNSSASKILKDSKGSIEKTEYKPLLENKELNGINSSKDIHEIPTVLNPCRQSIKNMKSQLEEKNNENSNSRKLIHEKSVQLSVYDNECKKLESRIEAKRKELATLAIIEKDTIMQISDINIDLEKVMNIYNNNSIFENINIKTIELMEKTTEWKRQSNYLGKLREDAKKLIQDTVEKEKCFNSLNLQLKQLKNEASSKMAEKMSKISDKKINQEVLILRIGNKSKIGQELGMKEKKTAEDIKKTIGTILNIYNNKQKLEDMILQTQIKIIEKERALSDLSYNFEDRKSHILQQHRKNKEEMGKNLKLKREILEREAKKHLADSIENLKKEINNFRKFGIECAMNQNEITKQNLKKKELLSNLENINLGIRSRQEIRKEIKRLKKQNKDEIEDLEMQIGILKSTILYKSQFSYL